MSTTAGSGFARESFNSRGRNEQKIEVFESETQLPLDLAL